MGRVRYNVATSLDGFIASEDGSTDWIVEDSTIDFAALHAQFGSFIMGRKTWETLLRLGDEDPVRKLKDVEIAVASTTLDATAYVNRGVTLLRSTEEILKWVQMRVESGGKDTWVYGGGALCDILLQAGLVDTVEVAIMPVLIGKGIRMLGSDEDHEGSSRPWQLLLQEVTPLKSGIVMCRYLISPN